MDDISSSSQKMQGLDMIDPVPRNTLRYRQVLSNPVQDLPSSKSELNSSLKQLELLWSEDNYIQYIPFCESPIPKNQRLNNQTESCYSQYFSNSVDHRGSIIDSPSRTTLLNPRKESQSVYSSSAVRHSYQDQSICQQPSWRTPYQPNKTKSISPKPVSATVAATTITTVAAETGGIQSKDNSQSQIPRQNQLNEDKKYKQKDYQDTRINGSTNKNNDQSHQQNKELLSQGSISKKELQQQLSRRLSQSVKPLKSQAESVSKQQQTKKTDTEVLQSKYPKEKEEKLQIQQPKKDLNKVDDKKIVQSQKDKPTKSSKEGQQQQQQQQQQYSQTIKKQYSQREYPEKQKEMISTKKQLNTDIHNKSQQQDERKDIIKNKEKSRVEEKKSKEQADQSPSSSQMSKASKEQQDLSSSPQEKWQSKNVSKDGQIHLPVSRSKSQKGNISTTKLVDKTVDSQIKVSQEQSNRSKVIEDKKQTLRKSSVSVSKKNNQGNNESVGIQGNKKIISDFQNNNQQEDQILVEKKEKQEEKKKNKTKDEQRQIEGNERKKIKMKESEQDKDKKEKIKKKSLIQQMEQKQQQDLIDSSNLQEGLETSESNVIKKRISVRLQKKDRQTYADIDNRKNKRQIEQTEDQKEDIVDDDNTNNNEGIGGINELRQLNKTQEDKNITMQVEGEQEEQKEQNGEQSQNNDDEEVIMFSNIIVRNSIGKDGNENMEKQDINSNKGIDRKQGKTVVVTTDDDALDGQQNQESKGDYQSQEREEGVPQNENEKIDMKLDSSRQQQIFKQPSEKDINKDDLIMEEGIDRNVKNQKQQYNHGLNDVKKQTKRLSVTLDSFFDKQRQIDPQKWDQNEKELQEQEEQQEILENQDKEKIDVENNGSQTQEKEEEEEEQKSDEEEETMEVFVKEDTQTQEGDEEEQDQEEKKNCSSQESFISPQFGNQDNINTNNNVHPFEQSDQIQDHNNNSNDESVQKQSTVIIQAQLDKSDYGNNNNNNNNNDKDNIISQSKHTSNSKQDKSDEDNINEELEEQQDNDPSFLQTESEPTISTIHESQTVKSFQGITIQPKEEQKDVIQQSIDESNEIKNKSQLKEISKNKEGIKMKKVNSLYTNNIEERQKDNLDNRNNIDSEKLEENNQLDKDILIDHSYPEQMVLSKPVVQPSLEQSKIIKQDDDNNNNLGYQKDYLDQKQIKDQLSIQDPQQQQMGNSGGYYSQQLNTEISQTLLNSDQIINGMMTNESVLGYREQDIRQSVRKVPEIQQRNSKPIIEAQSEHWLDRQKSIEKDQSNLINSSNNNISRQQSLNESSQQMNKLIDQKKQSQSIQECSALKERYDQKKFDNDTLHQLSVGGYELLKRQAYSNNVEDDDYQNNKSSTIRNFDNIVMNESMTQRDIKLKQLCPHRNTKYADNKSIKNEQQLQPMNLVQSISKPMNQPAIQHSQTLGIQEYNNTSELKQSLLQQSQQQLQEHCQNQQGQLLSSVGYDIINNNKQQQQSKQQQQTNTSYNNDMLSLLASIAANGAIQQQQQQQQQIGGQDIEQQSMIDSQVYYNMKNDMNSQEIQMQRSQGDQDRLQEQLREEEEKMKQVNQLSNVYDKQQKEVENKVQKDCEDKQFYCQKDIQYEVNGNNSGNKQNSNHNNNINNTMNTDYLMRQSTNDIKTQNPEYECDVISSHNGGRTITNDTQKINNDNINNSRMDDQNNKLIISQQLTTKLLEILTMTLKKHDILYENATFQGIQEGQQIQQLSKEQQQERILQQQQQLCSSICQQLSQYSTKSTKCYEDKQAQTIEQQQSQLDDCTGNTRIEEFNNIEYQQDSKTACLGEDEKPKQQQQYEQKQQQSIELIRSNQSIDITILRPLKQFKNIVTKILTSMRFFKILQQARENKKTIQKGIFDDMLKKAMSVSASHVFTACKNAFCRLFQEQQPLQYYLLPMSSGMYKGQLRSIKTHVIDILQALAKEKLTINDINVNDNAPPSSLDQQIESSIDILRFLNLISQNYQFSPESFWSTFIISRLEFSSTKQLIRLSKEQQKMIVLMFIILYGLINRLVRPWVTLNIQRTPVIAKNCQIIISVIFYLLFDYIDRNNPQRKEKQQQQNNKRYYNNNAIPSANTRPLLAYPELLSTETMKDLNALRNSSQEEGMLRLQLDQTQNIIAGISSRYLLKDLLVKDMEFVKEISGYFDIIAEDIIDKMEILHKQEKISLIKLFLRE